MVGHSGWVIFVVLDEFINFSTKQGHHFARFLLVGQVLDFVVSSISLALYYN